MKKRLRKPRRPQKHRSVAGTESPVVMRKEEAVMRRDEKKHNRTHYINVPVWRLEAHRQHLINMGAILDEESPQFEHDRNLGNEIWYDPDSGTYIVLYAARREPEPMPDIEVDPENPTQEPVDKPEEEPKTIVGKIKKGIKDGVEAGKEAVKKWLGGDKNKEEEGGDIEDHDMEDLLKGEVD